MTLSQRASFWSGFAYYLTTSMNALLAPLASLVMLWFFPAKISNWDVLPLLGAVLLWLVVFPCVAAGRWRIEVLRVQVIYSFAHLFCLLDLMRGRRLEWRATNATNDRRSGATRVRKTMAGYLVSTQALVVIGWLVDVDRYGLAHYWALIPLTVLNLYVFAPVGWLALVTTLRNARTASQMSEALA